MIGEQGSILQRTFVVAFAATAACLAWACGAADEEPADSETARIAEPLEETEWGFPEDAVVGTMKRLVAGRVVSQRTRAASAGSPPDLDELIASGATDNAGFVYTDVAGADSDGGSQVRYHYIRRTRKQVEPLPELPQYRPPVVHGNAIGEVLADAVREGDPDHVIEVRIKLKARFATSLQRKRALAYASLAHAEQDLEEKRAKIETRKAEAAELQASVAESVQDLGGTVISGFWLTNTVAADLPLGAVERLAAHPDVERVSIPVEGIPASTTRWDGQDSRDADGLNWNIYDANGYHGQAYRDVGGSYMRVAVFGGGFDADHPGFLDCVGCASRAVAWNCKGDPCVVGMPTNSQHATKVAGIIAGNIMQGQIPGFTTDERKQRSGPNREGHIYLIAIDGDTSDAERAIQKAVDLDVDVFVSSTDFQDSYCDGDNDDLGLAVYQAQLDGMVFVQAAGNTGSGGTCRARGISEAPSAFSVGALAGNPISSSNYDSAGIWSSSSAGGMDATVGGTNHSGALGLVNAVTVGQWYYWFNSSGGISTSTVVGTSYAAPQVGGAAILLEDWFLANGYSEIKIEGRLFAVLLAMADRYDGSTYRHRGYGNRWGAGRFQLRYFDDDDLAAPWSWEMYSVVFSTSWQYNNFSFRGTGTEPSGIGQFKATSIVFEDDNDDMADITMYVQDNNCYSDHTLEGDDGQPASDMSYDVAKMVRLGSSASGKALCIKTRSWYIPSGETRRLHVFAYHSGDTAMR